MNESSQIKNPHGRYVPWVSWDEWVHTYKLLYESRVAENNNRVMQALETMDAWRLRGRVPLAVEATATLKRIQLLDEQMETREVRDCEAMNALDAKALRLQYSLAIVRFVNGVADAAQKGRVAASVASLAHHAGIPRLLVDIRHESTHNELPTLRVLRLGARQAVEWLRRSYWEEQRIGIVRGREKVREVLDNYIGSLIMAENKEEGRRKIETSDDDDEAEGRKKKMRVRGDRNGDDEVDGRAPYCSRKAKRQRQAWLTQLRSMVPMGGEAVLVWGVRGVAVDSISSDKTRFCLRVLEQLGEFWQDLAAMFVKMGLDEAFLGCLDEGESSGGAHGDAKSCHWYRAANAILPEAVVGGIAESCIRRYCGELFAMHQTAFIEIQADPAFEKAAATLRAMLSEVCATSMVRTFIGIFLPVSLPTTSDGLDRMRQCVDEWTGGVKGGRAKNTSGWETVEEAAWRPCAIGMMPCEYLRNGSLPRLACSAACGRFEFKTEPETRNTLLSSPTETYETGAPSADGDDTTTMDDGAGDDLGDGVARGHLPPPPDFHLM